MRRDRAEMGDRLRWPAMRAVQDGVCSPYAGRWRRLFIPHDLGEGRDRSGAVRARQLDHVSEFSRPSARIARYASLKWPTTWSHLLSPAVLCGLPRCSWTRRLGCFMALEAARVESEVLPVPRS